MQCSSHLYFHTSLNYLDILIVFEIHLKLCQVGQKASVRFLKEFRSGLWLEYFNILCYTLIQRCPTLVLYHPANFKCIRATPYLNQKAPFPPYKSVTMAPLP